MSMLYKLDQRLVDTNGVFYGMSNWHLNFGGMLHNIGRGLLWMVLNKNL